jgi:glyceraldehyde 3-phosphate dehydrogenase
MKKIAINGFGGIGRTALKVIVETSDLEVVAINDLLSLENATYLLQYNSIYGKFHEKVTTQENALVLGNKKNNII